MPALAVPVAAESFTDSTTGDFAQGVDHDNTENVQNAVRLVSGFTDGLYTSRIFDAGAPIAWDNLNWTENEPTLLIQENDNVGSEPDPLVDSSSRSGSILGGTFEDTSLEDGVYENIGENVEDNTLNWEHIIENVETGRDNYTLRVRGFTGGDSEEVGVYIWNSFGSAWDFIDNLTNVETTIENTIDGAQISNYLVGGENIHVRFYEGNADATQTFLQLDLVTLEENLTQTSDVRLQARVSLDNVVWTEWLGPSGADDNFLTPSANNLSTVPENRYFQYRVFLSSENSLLSDENGPSIQNVTIEYIGPTWQAVETWGATVRTLGAPTLLSPGDGDFSNDNTHAFDWTDVTGATSYHLQVDNDSDFASPVINDPTLASSNYTPSSEFDDGLYYWKVRAKDGGLSSPWSSTWSFTIDIVSPSSTTPLTPENQEIISEDQPTFTWTAVTDPSGVQYTLTIDNDPDYSFPYYFRENLADNSHVPENKLVENFSPYYWFVTVTDNAGNENQSENFEFQLIVPPASSVGTISYYWENASPLAIDVTATDNDGTVENVELWYRFSSDNSGWGSWAIFDNDSAAPFSFSFTFDEGIGYYEFYSRAWDDRGNYENAPAEADTICGFDNVPPGIPNLLTPENNSTVMGEIPTFTWAQVSDFSGVTYELVVDDESTFTAPYVYDISRITDNWHAAENAFALGTYYWHVRTTDNARLENDWSDNFSFSIANWFLVETWSGTVATAGTWSGVETWSGTVEAPHGFKVIETWTGTVNGAAATDWLEVESWTGTINAPVLSDWQDIENWSGTLNTVPLWKEVETWAATVNAAGVWSEVESWSGAVTATAQWGQVESWTGTITTSATWSSVETWSCSITGPVPAPTLTSPDDGLNTQNTTPTFQWDNSQPADNFHLQADNDSDFWSPTIDAEGLTSNSYTPGSDMADDLYYWRVRAFRNDDNSAWSENWTVRVDTVNPATPTTVWPYNNENINDSTPNLDWDAPAENSFPLTYYVEVSPDKFTIVDNSWVSDDNWELTTPLVDNLYYWRAYTRDNAGLTSSFTTWQSFLVDTVNPDTPALVYPDNDSWVTATPNFDWDNVTENTLPVLYNLEIYYYPSMNPAENVWTTSENYVLTLDEGEYVWRLKARDNAGNDSAWSEDRWFKVDNAIPSQTTLYYPDNGLHLAMDSLTFEWQDATDSPSGVARYVVQVDDDEDFTSLTHENVNVSDNTYTYSFAATGTYYWRVRAVDNGGNEGPWPDPYWLRLSGWSEVESWTGTVNATAATGWLTVETWGASVVTTIQWSAVESWTGTVDTTANAWSEVESWSGTVISVATAWSEVETWSGTMSSVVADWSGVESWTGTIVGASLWRESESWSGTITATAQWAEVESWSATVNTAASLWIGAETWSGTVNTVTLWSEVETWSGTVVGPSGWREVETWSGTAVAFVLAPTLYSPTDASFVNDNTPALTWDNTKIVDNFHLQVDDDADFSSPLIDIENLTDNSYTVGSEMDDGVYYWRVRTFANGENSAWSENWTFRIDTLPPASPNLLWPNDRENINDGTPNLDWDAPSDNSVPLSYRIQVSTDTFFENIVAEALWTVYEDNWEVTPALGDNVYWWRVAARDNAGNPSNFTSGREFRVDTVTPDTPSLVSPENGVWSGTSPNFDWTPVTENTLPVTYNLVIAYDNDFSHVAQDIWTTDDNLAATLDIGTFYWRVKSRDNAGNESAWSDNWWLRVENTPPSKVSLYSPENDWGAENLTIVFEWVDATDADSGLENYWIQIDDDQGFGSLLHENSSIPSTENTYNYSFSSLGTYYWRVRASDNVGNLSDWSDDGYFRIGAWREVETWSGTIYTSVTAWNVVENWNSMTIGTQTGWSLVEGWSGTVSAQMLAGWQGVETWSGTVNSAALSWPEVENWSGTVTANVIGPVLVAPENASNTSTPMVTFEWENVPLSDNFQIQADNDDDFSSPEVDNVVTDNSFAFTFENDNLYTWRVRASVYGENSAWSENWTVRLDRVSPDPPSPVWPAHDENVGDNTPNFDWDAPEENSLPIQYRVQVMVNGDIYEDSGWITDDNWTSSELPDNYYYWRVQARDNSNNVGSFSNDRYFRIDTHPPVPPTQTAPLDISTNDQRPTFQWSEPAENSLPLTYRAYIYFNTTPPSLYTDSGWIDTLSWQPLSDLTEDNYLWHVKAMDNAGNEGDNSGFYWVNIDVTPPDEPTPTWPSNGENINDNLPNLDWNTLTLDNKGNTEPSTPILYYAALSDNSAFPYEIYNSGWITEDNWAPPSLEDGYWYWRVGAVDNAANYGENSATYGFRVDILAPENVTLLTPNNGENVAENTPLLDWSGAVENSLPVQYYVVVASDENFTDNVRESGWTENEDWTVTPALVDNDYWWKVLALDDAGNIYETEAWWFRVENTPPSVPDLLSPENEAWENDSTPLFTWENSWDISLPIVYYVAVSDNEEFPYENYNSGWTENENWEVQVALEDNLRYYWQVAARDENGKVSDNTAIRSFRVDTLPPPQMVPTLPDNLLITGRLNQTFKWNSIVDNSGITYWLQIDDEPTFAGSNIAYDNAPASPHYYNFPATGRYYWRMQAEDGAGNLGPWSDVFELYIGNWEVVESWSGTISAPVSSGWVEVESWSGVATGSVNWQTVESWNVTVVGTSVWSAIETWSGSLSTFYHSWDWVESIVSVTINAPIISGYSEIETWSGSVSIVPTYRHIETWTGLTISIPVSWTSVVVGVTPTQPLPRFRNAESWRVFVVAMSAAGKTENVQLPPGSTRVADFSTSAICVTAVEISAKQGVSGISSVKVSLDEKPSVINEVPENEGLVYQYFYLNYEGVSQSDVEKIEINFKVPKSWIDNGSVDRNNVSLMRLEGDWERLPAQLVGDDQYYFYYSATTTKTSLFAVLGNGKFAIPLTPTTGPPMPGTETASSPALLGLLAVLGAVGAAIGVAYYKTSWANRPADLENIEKQFERAMKGLGGDPAKERLKNLGSRMNKNERLKMARLNRSMLEGPLRLPKIIPTRKQMAKQDAFAVSRLEAFVQERRKVARPPQAEKPKIARIRRQLSKEEAFALRRLERFMTKRRAVAPPTPKRKAADGLGAPPKKKAKTKVKRKSSVRPKRTKKVKVREFSARKVARRKAAPRLKRTKKVEKRQKVKSRARRKPTRKTGRK